MGHIELAAPCSHIWYFKGIPSRMGLILDISPRSLEKVLYFVSYIVTDPGDTPVSYTHLDVYKRQGEGWLVGLDRGARDIRRSRPQGRGARSAQVIT